MPQSILPRQIVLSILFFTSSILVCASLSSVERIQEEQRKIGGVVEIDFEIISKELKEGKSMKPNAYLNNSIIAVMKQTNLSDAPIELWHHDLVTRDNIQIIDVSGENKTNLLAKYDYDLVIDPIGAELPFKIVEVLESIIDTIDIAPHLCFYESEIGTYFIRVKKKYFGETIYSNWDTLSIE